MRSTFHRARLAGALAGVAIAATGAVPAAHAMPIDPAQTARSPDVPPPPSSMAVSARNAYEELRSAGTRDKGADYSTPVVDAPSGPAGFDWASAAIGAAAAAGLSLVSVGVLGRHRLAGRRPASA